MSSPGINSSGGDISQLYQQQQIAPKDDLGEVFADGRAVEMQQDSLGQSPTVDKQLKQLGEDTSAPKLFPPSDKMAHASDQQITNLKQMIQSLGSGEIGNLKASLPFASREDPEVQMALGGMQGQKQLDALASIGLESLPDLSSLNFANISFPSPGAIDPTASVQQQKAQLFSNQVDTAGKQVQMAGAEAAALPSGTPNADSLNTFLAAISQAISELQKFLGGLQTGGGGSARSGQPAEPGAQVQKGKSEAAAGPSTGGAGPMGDLLGPIADTFKGVPVIGDLLSGGGGLGGGLGDMLSGVTNMDVPILGDLLKSVADMTSGIPIVGDTYKMLADKPMIVVLGAVTFAAGTALTLTLGPMAPVVGITGATLVMGGLMLSDGGEGGMLKDIPVVGGLVGGSGGLGGNPLSSSPLDDGKLGKFLRSDIPIVGDMFKGYTELFAPIPILGDLMAWGGDNQMAFGIGVTLMCCCAPMLLPVAIPVIMTVMGDGDKMPIIGDLLGGGKPVDKSADSKANSHAGETIAVVNAYGVTTKTIAEDGGVAEENAQMAAQIQKLIAMLVSMKAAAQNGNQAPVPSAQMLSIVENLSAHGIGGEAFKQAITAGQRGDTEGMVSSISKGFSDTGTNTDSIASLFNFGGGAFKLDDTFSVDGFKDTIMSLIPA
ncbi:MAG: hypothetical protein Q8K75_11260 [Chlamydiales bacterium]|nr:hypothetical protein [Chlamydiales bacterium]